MILCQMSNTIPPVGMNRSISILKCRPNLGAQVCRRNIWIFYYQRPPLKQIMNQQVFFTNENIVYTRYLQVADLLSSQWVLTIKRFRKRIAWTPRGSIRLKVVILKNGFFYESRVTRYFIKISFIGIWKLRAGTNEAARNSVLHLQEPSCIYC